MRNVRQNQNMPPHQKGMTLLVAMITLIVLMLMGVGAMVASNTMFKLAGNVQFENEAKNRAENALTTGERWLMTPGNTTNAGFTTSAAPYFAPGTSIAPLTDWSNLSAVNAGNNTQQYVIQRITTAKVSPPGYSTCMNCPPSAPTPSYDLYRVIARGSAGRGATRYVESIVQVP